MDLGEFWGVVTILVQAFDGRVTSGPRSQKENQRVGGVPDSMHIVGLGADVVLADWKDKQAFIRLANRVQLAVIDEQSSKNHLHLQPASANPPRGKAVA
jgi:hypothetical protein